MIRLLMLVGIAYRMRRSRRLLRCGRLAECGRVMLAIERDFGRLADPA